MKTMITLPEGNVKPVKTGTVPALDLELGKVAVKVNAKWNEKQWLTLQWTTHADFALQAQAYFDTVNVRHDLGAERPQVTADLKALDKKIDSSLSYVKGYIVDKYKKEKALSYFPAFGIVHVSDGYRMPYDQNKRSQALGQMVKAIAKNGFDNKEFGKAFWSGIKTEYDTLLGIASATDGTISIKVGDKNILKKVVKQTLNAIVNVIRGNFPDTYKQELRDWGFQKEKY